MAAYKPKNPHKANTRFANPLMDGYAFGFRESVFIAFLPNLRLKKNKRLSDKKDRSYTLTFDFALRAFMNQPYYIIHYEFIFPGGDYQEFELVLDESTMSLVNFNGESKPEWAALAHKQCRCCPLDQAENPYCPIAVNIAELVDNFKENLSIEQCQVKCVTPERTYLKETTVQAGLYSILGIVMATSDCPIMNFYKPMARFHLPFSTTQETVFRSASVYLLQQYFEFKRGRKPDIGMAQLGKQLQQVQQVNIGIIARIRSISIKDADANAIIILDSFAKLLEMAIEKSLSSLEHLFPPKD